MCSCELCGGNIDGSNKSSLRGLTLCYTCNAGLGGGKFSAPIVQQERRAMNCGTLLIDRPPLPKKISRCINGPAVELPRVNWQPPAKLAPQPVAELPPPPAESPVPPQAPAVEPRRPRVTRRPRKPRQLAPANSPATDWRTNGRAVLAAVHV
jgi:hypothetical protein